MPEAQKKETAVTRHLSHTANKFRRMAMMMCMMRG